MASFISNATGNLIKAYIEEDDNAVKEAIEQGADVNVKDTSGRSLLHKACDNGSVYLIKLLLENGADVNIKDNEGKTPLYNACFRGSFNKIKLLLEYGADVNVKDNDGLPPLDYVLSIYYDEPKIKQLLKDWQAMEQNGTRPPAKKPTFGGKVNTTTDKSVAPTPEQQAAVYVAQVEELKKAYLNLSSTEIAKCFLSTDDYAKVQKLFSGNFEPLVKKMTHQEAMRVYVHIYKKFSDQEHASFKKGIMFLKNKEKPNQPNIIKKQKETMSL